MHIHKPVPKKRIAEVCREFMGPIYQKPPLKSSVVKELRIRTIYYLDILEIEEQQVLMRVGCEAGTYIRKLCFDIGLALGCGANMEELRRTRAGPFREDGTLITLHNLADAVAAWKEKGDEAGLRRCIQPVEAALSHLPRLVIADNAVDAVCHGAPLAAPGLLSLQTDINKGDTVAFFTQKGEAVAVGVAQMNSREMLASQREYLLALRSREIMKGSPLSDSQQQSDSLLAASRKRLELFSLSDAQIQEITRTQQPLTNITIYSPLSGYVMMRNAFPKQRITPETELYTVVDLSKVWIMADVFENEAPMVRLGQQVSVSLAGGRGKAFRARVSYIQPQVDPTTRTIKVRLELSNPGMILKPDMFVNAVVNPVLLRRGLAGGVRGDFRQAIMHKDEIVSSIRSNFPSLLKRSGIHMIRAAAQLACDGDEIAVAIQVDGASTAETLTTKRVIIATGSQPRRLDLCPNGDPRVISSRTT